MLGPLIIAINFAIAISAVGLFFYTRPFRKWPMIRYLQVTNVAFLILAFCTTQVLAVQDFDDKVMFSRFRFLGIALLAPSYLLFASHLTNRLRWLRTRTGNVLLYLPSIVTIVATLTPSLRDLMVRDFHPFAYAGLSLLTFGNGPWLWVHVGTGYLEVLAYALLCAWVAIIESGRLRHHMLVLLGAIVSSISFDIICLASGSPLRWAMLTTSLYGVNQFVLFYAASSLGLGDIRDLAKRKIFDLVPDPMIAVDSRGRLAGVNDAAVEVFGLSNAKIAQPIDSLLTPQQRRPGEVRLKKVDGTEAFFVMSIVPLEASGQASIGELYSFKEITNEKKIEQELIGLLSVLSHDLAGTIHHQARLSDVVAQKLPAGEEALATALIESTAANRDLIHNLVLWSKSQRDELRRQHRPFEINALVEDTIELTKPLWSSKRITIVSEKIPQTIVSGNSGMISSVLRNFISNAVRASANEAFIQIKMEISPTELTVTVVDQGYGMASTRSEIRDGSSGYGIGLILGRRFIEQHGGTLALDDNKPQGTRASIKLPLSKN